MTDISGWDEWLLCGCITVTLPCWFPIYCCHRFYKKRRDRVHAEELARHNWLLECPHSPQGAHPLPRPKFRLSIPSADENLPSNVPFAEKQLQPWQKTLSQEKSIFSKLPQELRRLIWEHVVGNQNLFLATMDDKKVHHCELRSIQRSYHVPTASPGKCQCDTCIEAAAVSAAGKDQSKEAKLKRGLLSLLLTCRQYYTEAQPLLYQTNSFTLQSYTTFEALHSTLRPSHFNSLTCLTFALPTQPLGEPHPDPSESARYDDLQDKLIRILALMRGLRHLDVLLAHGQAQSYIDLISEVGPYEAGWRLGDACYFALWRLSDIGELLGQELLRKDKFVVRVCVTCDMTELLDRTGLPLEEAPFTFVIDGDGGEDEDEDDDVDVAMDSEEAAMMYLRMRWFGDFGDRQMVYARRQ